MTDTSNRASDSRRSVFYRLLWSSLLLLLLTGTTIYTARVSILNKLLEHYAPTYELRMHVAEIDIALLQRSITFHQVSLRYAEQYQLKLNRLVLAGIAYEDGVLLLGELLLADPEVYQLGEGQRGERGEQRIFSANELKLVTIAYHSDKGVVTIGTTTLDAMKALLVDRAQLASITQLKIDNIQSEINELSVKADVLDVLDLRLIASETKSARSGQQHQLVLGDTGEQELVKARALKLTGIAYRGDEGVVTLRSVILDAVEALIEERGQLASFDQLKVDNIQTDIDELSVKLDLVAVLDLRLVATQRRAGIKPAVSGEQLQLDSVEAHSLHYENERVSAGLISIRGLNVFVDEIERLIAWKNLDITDIRADRQMDEIIVDALTLQQFQFAEAVRPGLSASEPVFVQLNETRVKGVQLRERKNLEIKAIQLAGGEMQLQIDADGQLTLLPAKPIKTEPIKTEPTKTESTKSDADQAALRPVHAEKEQSPSMYYLLQSFTLDDDMSISFRDASVSPAAEQRITLKQLKLDNLHNGESGAPSKLSMSGKVGEHGTFSSEITFLLATIQETSVLKLDIDNFELPSFSGYSRRGTGYALESGQLDLDVKLDLQQRQLAGKTTIDMRQLNMKPADDDLIEQMNQQLTMPLPTALYLLEDGDGNIELDVPIKGDLDNPSFSWNSIFRILTLRALKEASYYYVKNTLFPSNLLISAATVAGGQLYKKMNELSALEFLPTDAALREEHLAFLNNVAVKLKKKKKLNIRVCSVATVADALENEQRLVLAKQRAGAVREYLVAQGVKSPQLMTCLDRVDEEAEQAYVKLKL